jgi:hypothetical protein
MDSSYYRSVEVDKISAALSKAQGTYKPLAPDTDSAHGKFASLRAILGAARDALSANALAFHQHIEILDEGVGASLLVSTLSHESGQHIGSVGRIIAGKTDRRTGNIVEIHKRIHAQMILGIAPSEHDPISFDDDGEEISQEVLVETIRKGKKSEVVIDREDTISKEQHDELLIELDCEEGPNILRDMYQCYNIETLADLPREEYHKARTRILKLKRTNEDYRSGRAR